MKPMGIVRSVVRRHDADKLAVLADWCEEHELVEAAGVLREEPGGHTRCMVEALHVVLSGATAYSVFWKEGWVPEKCDDCGKQRLLSNYWLPRRRSVRVCKTCWRTREAPRGARPLVRANPELVSTQATAKAEK